MQPPRRVTIPLPGELRLYLLREGSRLAEEGLRGEELQRALVEPLSAEVERRGLVGRITAAQLARGVQFVSDQWDEIDRLQLAIDSGLDTHLSAPRLPGAVPGTTVDLSVVVDKGLGAGPERFFVRVEGAEQLTTADLAQQVIDRWNQLVQEHYSGESTSIDVSSIQVRGIYSGGQ